MARQNQGLQITLIVFIVLTIGLGVTAFFLSSQASESEQRATKLEKKADALQDANLNIVDENNRLKTLMGFPETMEFGKINAEVEEDLNTYAANYQGETRGYHQVVAYLFQTVQDKMGTVADLQAQLETLEAKLPQIERGARAQIAKHEEQRKAAETARQAEAAKFKQTVDKLASDKQEFNQRIGAARAEAQKVEQKYETELEQRGKKIVTLTTQRQDAVKRLRKLETKSFDVADGEVIWVDHRNKKVWINIGRDKALPAQTSFAVYGAEVSAPSEDKVKGSIEVTSVSENTAEARIVDDSIRNPIMRGDKIHTPLWAPGEQRRFALAGDFDIDDDGRSDVDMIRNLITMNGGKVDAYTDPQGKIQGQLTLKTRYLVLGNPPDGDSPQALIESYGDIKRQAEGLSIEKIQLSKLLDMMGYRPESEATTGRGETAGSVARRATGRVSDLYNQQRERRAGGAY